MKTIKTLIYVIIGIIFFIFALLFAMSNMSPTITLKFYRFETFPMPPWFLVAISILIGAIFVVFLILQDLYRSARKAKKLKKEIKVLEKELNFLKSENKRLTSDEEPKDYDSSKEEHEGAAEIS